MNQNKSVGFVSLALVALIMAGCAIGSDTKRLAVTPEPTPVPTVVTPAPTPAPIVLIPCSVQSKPFLARLDELAAEWDDATALANSTARVSLSGPVARMQEIRRELDSTLAPSCIARAKSELVRYMSESIEGFLLFMSQAPDYDVTLKFRSASSAMDSAKSYISQMDK